MMVVGIDPSLSATGVCDYEGATHTVRTQPDDTGRLVALAVGVRLAARLWEYEQGDGGEWLAVLEDLPKHAQGAGLTGMAQGVIRYQLQDLSLPYITVTAATLKKFATGKGNATKPDMRMALFKRAGIDERDDNRVDAWWLRQIGLHLTGNPDALPLPKSHTEALEKVRWP